MTKKTDKEKIIVGLSGGVDSSVATLLLLKAGYEVEGLFMKNWEEDDHDDYCGAAKDLADANSVARQLNIKMNVVNFATEYWNEVFSHFLLEYKKGYTPNPDVLCNEKIKFEVFLKYALSLGASKIATGHYARIVNEDGTFYLKEALDAQKDQSYFLHRLNQKKLSLSLFPLGAMSKKMVRQLAKKHNLITANKKDSSGICFIGKRNFHKFLTQYLHTKSGDIIDENKRVIKQHDGIEFYTIGQRKGLGIGGGFSKSNKPWFVADKNLQTNELLVVEGEHPYLYHRCLSASNIHWINKTYHKILHCQARIRHRQEKQPCSLEVKNNHLILNFKTKQRAITPGQAVVLYQGDVCLGGGVIKTRF